ncbi:(S)-sulfolactate dehydrogenase [Paenibacillus konkukensis]|uniref:(S)-sulfolactate dehydrogenase n=1 Tax=Paenibacillus konkukensis TaxID=2020716 RepID=A0ABY4RH37_9BACL|nr:hydroxyacid dehydrogenase [Paenibacillus konkukensis]UQZ80939.1 (S)-sulfolactate dehydrogenase [Paenibacillus konkukensis]
MKKRAVFLGDPERIRNVYQPQLRQELETLADVYPEIVNKDRLQQHAPFLQTAEILFSTWGMPALTEEEIKRFLPNLRALFYAAGSVQNFAKPFLYNDVIVVSAWAANAVPVAEYTAAQIVLANKGFYQSALLCKERRQAAARHARAFPGNYNAKVGILGAGMIGKKVIELLKPYQLDIYVFDPYLPDAAAEQMQVKKAGLIELFSQCHTISNHLANLPATVGLVNKEHFSRMLPYATLINTGRGRQFVERDLIEALRAVPTRTAVLDVTYPEPVPEDSELLQLDNVILTPHIAGSNPVEAARMAEYVIDEFRRYLHEEALQYQVSLKMLETMA